MSAEHTPTPWLLDEDCFDEDVVEITSQDRLDNSMGEIAAVQVGGFDDEVEAQQRANAEFIVRAVNAHADLVAALDAAQARCEIAVKEGREFYGNAHDDDSADCLSEIEPWTNLLNQVCGALAKASA